MIFFTMILYICADKNLFISLLLVLAFLKSLYLAVLLAAAVVTVELLRIFVHHISMQLRRPGEPPVIWSWVPIIGLDLYINLARTSIIDFIHSHRRKKGEDVVAVVTAGQRTVYLLNPNDFRTALFNARNKDVTFDYFVERAICTFGATRNVAPMRQDLLTKNLRHVLMGRRDGDFFGNFFSKVNSSLDQYSISKETTDTESFLYKALNHAEGCNLFDLALDITQHAIFSTLLGESFSTPALRKAMSNFDEAFPYIFADIFPKLFLRSALESREHILEDIMESPSAVWELCSQDSKCREALEKLREDERTNAATRFSFIWASVGQAGPTSFWSILHILADPNLRKIITEEIEEVLEQCKDKKGEGNSALLSRQGLTQIDSLKLIKLESVILESLRMYTSASGVRSAVRDTTITTAKGTKYNIRKGDWINGAYFLVHKDERFFENPNEFKWDRFLGHVERNASFDKESGSLLSHEAIPKNFFAFGGGAQQCPGRKLAFMTIKSVIVWLLTDLKLDLVSGKTGEVDRETLSPVCGANQSVYGVGMFRPMNDVRVRAQI